MQTVLPLLVLRQISITLIKAKNSNFLIKITLRHFWSSEVKFLFNLYSVLWNYFCNFLTFYFIVYLLCYNMIVNLFYSLMVIFYDSCISYDFFKPLLLMKSFNLMPEIS